MRMTREIARQLNEYADSIELQNGRPYEMHTVALSGLGLLRKSATIVETTERIEDTVSKAITELEVCHEWADGAMKSQLETTINALRDVTQVGENKNE